MRHRFGIAVDLHQPRAAAFLGPAERFFQHICQPACLIAGADHAVDLRVAALGIVQPPIHAFDQLAPHLFTAGTPGQQVFDAENLGRFRKDRRAAVAHEDISRRPQTGVGREPRKPVRPAALHPDGDMFRRTGLTPDGIGLIQHFAHRLFAFGNRAGRAADMLHGDAAQHLALGQPLLFKELGEVVALTTQRQDHGTGQIGVADIARERAAQQVHRLARKLHSAAGFVDEGDHPVDVLPCLHPLFVEVIGDLARHGGRAIHGDEKPDVVARADPAIGAADAHELGALLRWQQLGRGIIAGKGIVFVNRVELDVMAVQPIACGDLFCRIADHRVEFQDRRAALDRADRDLVTLGRIMVGTQPVLRQYRATGNRRGCHDHVIRR